MLISGVRARQVCQAERSEGENGADSGYCQRSDRAVTERRPLDLAPGKPLVTSESQMGQVRAQAYDSAG